MWIAALLLLLAAALCDRPANIRVATFNIENFPKSRAQIDGAFKTIADLDAAAVGVQEIVDTEVFLAEAQKRLGASWQFVHAPKPDTIHVGVLYDSSRLTLKSTRSWPFTRVYPGARPVFEARFATNGGRPLRLFVLHLKAGAEGVMIRKLQLKALRSIIKPFRYTRDRIVVLGDFNSTSPEDRDEIADLAEATDMIWATESLECTSYWARRDGCRGSALDHVLVSNPPRDAKARGPCETIGCKPGRTCPVFHRQVSDHCPVTVDLR